MELYDGVTQVQISSLLSKVHQESLGLPDFQRDYVWDPNSTIGLIASTARHYPAGTILTVGNSQDYFATRKFEDAPSNGIRPDALVLDGQQRLTSLYQAFYGCGEYRFYLDLTKYLADLDLVESEVISYEKATRKKNGKSFHDLMVGDFAYQAQNKILPLMHLFGPGENFHSWLLKTRNELPIEERDDFEKKMNSVFESFVQPIQSYLFPVVALSGNASLAALCTIFETLNRTGVKLTIFELLTARFWPAGINLRTLWDQSLEEFPVLKTYGVEPYQIIQAISLVSHPSATCKRDDILNLKPAVINDWWRPAVEAMVYGLEILSADCRIVNEKWLPTAGMLGPLAAVLAIGESLPNATKAVRRAQVSRWIWCAIFSQRYEAAANTRGEKDVNEIREWFNDSTKVPESITQFTFDPNTLRFIASKNAGVYKGVICLTMKTNGGSRDFMSGGLITSQLVMTGEVDDHHIFPSNYLKETKKITDKTLINCVTNRTLIDRETNNFIRDKAPSVYIGGLEAPNVTQVLDSHLIPSGTNGPLTTDDYELFLEKRSELIVAKITEVTGE